MTESKIIDNARICAAQLKDAGLLDWERRIIDAIDSGSTGGEIVMTLRWNLQELLKAHGNLPETTQHLARKIIQEIIDTGW